MGFMANTMCAVNAVLFMHSLESVRQCGVALCIVLGFSILSASLGSSVVRDRVTGAKRLQHISGLGYRTYWLANFLYDMVGLGTPSFVPLCSDLFKGRGGWKRANHRRGAHFPSSVLTWVCHQYRSPLAN